MHHHIDACRLSGMMPTPFWQQNARASGSEDATVPDAIPQKFRLWQTTVHRACSGFKYARMWEAGVLETRCISIPREGGKGRVRSVRHPVISARKLPCSRHFRSATALASISLFCPISDAPRCTLMVFSRHLKSEVCMASLGTPRATWIRDYEGRI